MGEGRGQCNSTGLNPLNYVILQQKLSTDSLRAIAKRELESPWVTLCVFSQLWADISKFHVIPQWWKNWNNWAYITQALSKPVKCQEKNTGCRNFGRTAVDK